MKMHYVDFWALQRKQDDFASFLGWASCLPYKNHPLIQQRRFLKYP
ncbi:hypothetical protein [Nostoc sp. WHI]|nr:hypothetical protein [Nostoc sp. WHI]